MNITNVIAGMYLQAAFPIPPPPAPPPPGFPLDGSLVVLFGLIVIYSFIKIYRRKV